MSQKTSKGRVRYALSIHMKYGEVLHIDDLSREERDRYFELARTENASIIVEDKSSVRNVMGKDISKISAKAYNEDYKKLYYPLEKMMFSESSLGRRVFHTVIKAFVLLAFFAIIAVFGMAVIEGNIMDVFFDGELFSKTIFKGFALIDKLFGYAVFAMIILNFADLLLGLRAHYHINQDGAYPVETTRISNVGVTVVFAIVFFIAKTVLVSLTKLL